MRIKSDFFYSFKVPIYGSVVILSSGSKRKRTNAFLEARGKDPIEGEQYHAFVNSQPPYFTLCINDTFKEEVDTLGHEVFHLTYRILEWHSVNWTSENHEPFAYLQGWLLDEIYKRINYERPRNRTKARGKH